MSKRYSKYLSVFIFICDLLLLNIAVYYSQIVLPNFNLSASANALFLLVINLAWILVSIVTKCFKAKRPLVLADNANSILLAFSYHLLLVFGTIYFVKIYNVSMYEIMIGYTIFFLLIIIHRSVLFFLLDVYRKKGYNHRNILIIGEKEIATRLENSFSQNPEYGYDLADFISDEQVNSMSEVLLLNKILNKKPDEIFICYKRLNPSLLKCLIGFAEENFIKIKVVSDLVLTDNYARLVNYGNIPVLQITRHPEVSFKILFLKRCFDILFSLLIITLGAPIFLLLFIITKTSSKGPAFYRQERIGRNEKPFYIYKFRSMHVNAEECGPQLAKDNDPRITKWGIVMRKTRLDELPQFWNVIKGEMSVVGPRPERQHFIEKIIEKTPDYKKLLRLRPGITSIGQVHYGYAENIDEMCARSKFDLLYLQNINLNSDLDIIFKTVKVMLQAKGK